MRIRLTAPRPCSLVFAILVCLTGLTYIVAELGLAGGAFTFLVLLFAVVKAQLVADHFMGLRRVTGFWRPLILGYLTLLGLGIALSYLPG